MAMEQIAELGDRIEQRRPKLHRYRAYVRGEQPGAWRFIADEVREQVGRRLAPVIVNWPRMAVGAIEERLHVEGFDAGSDELTERLWGWWLANELDEQAGQAHADALTYGSSYLTVWTGDEHPTIAVESPRQMIVDYAPGTGERRAALKLWREDGYGHAVLFGREQITTWRSERKLAESGEAIPATGWQQVDEVVNPLGVVPVVELRNRAGLLGDVASELDDVIPLADAISKLATDMMVSAEFHAMPRRWATGVEIPEVDADDDEEAFAQTPGRTWLLEDPQARVGQFPEANLSGFTNGIELLTQQLASISGLPPHYLNSLTGQLPSAESLRSAEASLVAKVRRRQRTFGRAWSEAARLAVMVADGVEPASPIRTLWTDPETRTFAQQADAAAKLYADGLLPWSAAMERLGYAPDEIEQMRSQRRQEALDGQGLDLEGLGS